MRRSSLLLMLAGALLGACGDDGGGKGRAVTVEAGQTLRVLADEYSFDPSRVTLSGPGELRLELRNEGNLAHNLKLERDGRTIGGTPTFDGGRRRSVSIELEPGRYDLVCTVGDHAELGMTGSLEVR